MKASKAPTGRRIVLELVNELQERRYPLFYRTLTPSLYHVYLHPEDYREIEGIAPLIVADAQKALDARVARLNRQSRWLLADAAPLERPAAGWDIHIHADANGELGRGELGIVSQLSIPAPPQFSGGTPTARIVRTVVTSSTRRSQADEGAPLAPAVTQPAAVEAEGTVATDKPDLPRAVEPELKAFARLAYVDEQGAHVYAMKKDVISIGRGGREHWVDVQLVTSARVSREHCRIRRDDRGRFYLHDLSTWGTTIDGVPASRVAGAADSSGAEAASAPERELPAQARIALADALVIDFVAQ